MGALSEAECRRVLAAFDLAKERGLPVEWVPVSSGAKIAWDSGTENLDWTARVLARIIEFTQGGGVVNMIVDGVSSVRRATGMPNRRCSCTARAR